MTVTLVPRHVDGVVLRRAPGGAELVVADGSAAVTLDSVALALWEMCDGDTSVEEMTDATCSLFDAGSGTVQRDIQHLLDALVQQRLLEWAQPDDRASTGTRWT